MWLPAWPIDLRRRRDRAAREPGAGPASTPRPTLLVARDHQREIVARCCDRAHAAGVRAGMPAAQARALFERGGVRIEPHEPERDAAALRALAVWAQRFSPVVAVDADHPGREGLRLDLTGCARVFGGEDQLLRAMHAGFARLGVRAEAAIAPTFGCAWAAARFGAASKRIIEPGGLRETIAPMPIEALGLERSVARDLAALGIERVEHLLELPRSTLPARFGDGLLLQLDRVLGRAIEPIDPVRPPAPPAVERILDGPTDRPEAIELIVRTLLEELSERLGERGVGARSLRIELDRPELPPEQLSITLGHPSRDTRHLRALLGPRLERAHLGFGVEAVRVRADSVGRLRHEQDERWVEGRGASPGGPRDGAGGAGGEADRACAELIDTLGNRLGTERVRTASMVESHLPERAFETRSAAHGTGRSGARAGITARDRPTVLLERPALAEVVALTPDGPVRRVRWNGQTESVLECLGPERIAGAWWRGRSGARDCFRVRCESGRWLWLVRGMASGRWFVHGLWA